MPIKFSKIRKTLSNINENVRKQKSPKPCWSKSNWPGVSRVRVGPRRLSKIQYVYMTVESYSGMIP